MPLSANLVQQMYVAYFGRPADPGGLSYFAQFDESALVRAFASSPESIALFGGATGPAAVDAIYQNLFNRNAEAGGIAYWSDAIGSGRLSLADAALAILRGALNDDSATIANKVAVAAEFTARVDTAAEIGGYAGSTAAANARNYLKAVGAAPASRDTALASVDQAVSSAAGGPGSLAPSPSPGARGIPLTTAAGEQVAGGASDDAFTGIVSATPGVSTFNSGDVVDGGAGIDRFDLTVSGDLSGPGVVPTGAWRVADVEIVNIVHTDDTNFSGSILADASNFGAGLRQFWQTDDSAAGVGTFSSIAVGPGVTAGFRSTGVDGTAVAANVAISGTTGGGALAAALDGVASGSSIAFAGSGAVTVNGSVAGSGALAIAAGNASTTLNAGLATSGAIGIAGAALSTIDFSASTGNVSATLAGLAATLSVLKGGAGNDAFTVAPSAGRPLAIDLGAGSDTLNVNPIGPLAGAASGGPDGNWTVSNAEVVNLVVSDTTPTGSYLLNRFNYAGLQQLWQVDDTVGGGTLSDITVGAGVTAGFRSTANVAADVSVTGSSLSSPLRVAVDGIAANSTIRLNNASQASLSGSFAGSGTSAIRLDNNVTGLNVGLASAGTISLASNAVSTLDFSASTGSIAASLVAVASSLTNLKGGSAADGFSVLALTNKALSIDLGSGDDTLRLGQFIVPAGTPQNSTVTLGAGRDTLRIDRVVPGDSTTVANVADASSSGFQAGMIVVTDFAAGQDVLDLAGNGRALSGAALSTILGSSSLHAAAQAAAALANGGTVVFGYGADAYVLVDGANAGSLGAGDGLVKLAGVDATQLTAAGGNLVP